MGFDHRPSQRPHERRRRIWLFGRSLSLGRCQSITRTRVLVGSSSSRSRESIRHPQVRRHEVVQPATRSQSVVQSSRLQAAAGVRDAVVIDQQHTGRAGRQARPHSLGSDRSTTNQTSGAVALSACALGGSPHAQAAAADCSLAGPSEAARRAIIQEGLVVCTDHPCVGASRPTTLHASASAGSIVGARKRRRRAVRRPTDRARAPGPTTSGRGTRWRWRAAAEMAAAGRAQLAIRCGCGWRSLRGLEHATNCSNKMKLTATHAGGRCMASGSSAPTKKGQLAPRHECGP